MPLALERLVEQKKTSLEALVSQKKPSALEGLTSRTAVTRQPVELPPRSPAVEAPQGSNSNFLTKAAGVAGELFYAPSRFAESALNRLTFGLYPEPEPAKTFPGKAAEVAGRFAGEAVPFMASYGSVGKLAGAGLSKLAPKAGKLAQLAVKGGLSSAAVGAAEAAVQGEEPGEIARQAGIYGGLGAAGDVALQGLVAPAVGKALGKLAKRRPPAAMPVSEAVPAETTAQPKRYKVETPLPKPEGVPVQEKAPILEQLRMRRFPQTVARADLTAPELRKLIKENPQLYKPITNKETLEVAQRLVDENFDAAKALVSSGKSFDNATEAAMAQDIVRRLQDGKRWDEAFEVMSKAAEKFTQAGQTVQAASMWRRLTPEGMLKYTHRVFEQANRQLPEGKKLSVTPELQKKLYDAMKQIEVMPDGIERDQAVALVLNEIESNIPVTLARKLSTLQAMSHLLNARTTLRNLFGNMTFAVAETVSNLWAIPVDKAFSLFTGKRTTTLPGFKEPLLTGLARAAKAAKEVQQGVSVEPGKYELFKGRTFRGGILGQLEKGLGYTLRVPDEFFKGFREKQSLQQMMRMARVSEPTQEMLEQAAYEARYSTFQDESLPARILQGLKDITNKLGVGKTIPGAETRTTQEFGLGDFLVKYTRVPGNLISRAVEYTPAGYLRALSLMADARKTGVLNQREMALTLGRPMSGSSVIGLGAWLHNQGLLISEDKERDKDARALERSEGLGNYKLNLSGVKRMLSGGDPALQPGDELYSYNWLEPVSVGLAIGATVDAQLKKQGTPSEMAAAIAANSVDEILDLPTLYIIKSMTYEGLKEDSNGFTIATVPLAEGMSGFIPGPVRQLAQMKDPVARETKGKTPAETAALKIKSAIPGVREELEPRLSPFGEEITYPAGIVTSMVSPATKSVYDPTGVTEKLKKLEDLTGENRHYPASRAPKSFVYRKEKFELTPQEQTEFQRIAGKRAQERFEKILGRLDIESLSDAQQGALVKKLADVVAESREIAKLQIIRGRQ